MPQVDGVCHARQNEKESIANFREAIQTHIEVLEEDGQAVPGDRFETLVVAV